MTKNGKPKRCRICKVAADVDSSGRCPSCACVVKAEAWGMHYGDYMAMRYSESDYVPKPKTPRIGYDKGKRCCVCGTPIPDKSNRLRYCSPECYEQAKNRGCTEAHRKARERGGIMK